MKLLYKANIGKCWQPPVFKQCVMRKYFEYLREGGHQRRVNKSTGKTKVADHSKEQRNGRQWPVTSISEAIPEQPSFCPGPQAQGCPEQTKQKWKKILAKSSFLWKPAVGHCHDKSQVTSLFKLSLTFSADKKPPCLVYYLVFPFFQFFPQSLCSERGKEESKADSACNGSCTLSKLVVRDPASLNSSSH